MSLLANSIQKLLLKVPNLWEGAILISEMTLQRNLSFRCAMSSFYPRDDKISAEYLTLGHTCPILDRQPIDYFRSELTLHLPTATFEHDAQTCFEVQTV